MYLTVLMRHQKILFWFLFGRDGDVCEVSLAEGGVRAEGTWGMPSKMAFLKVEAPRLDNIPAEFVQARGYCTIDVLTIVCYNTRRTLLVRFLRPSRTVLVSSALEAEKTLTCVLQTVLTDYLCSNISWIK